jgi:hypothetical protein
MIVYKAKNNNSLFIDGISIPSSGLPIENESDRRFERLENLVKLGFIIRVESEESSQSSVADTTAEVKKTELNSNAELVTESKSNEETAEVSYQPPYKVISQNNKKMIIDSNGDRLKDENGKNLKFDTVESAQAHIDALSL